MKKRIFALALTLGLLAGCAPNETPPTAEPEVPDAPSAPDAGAVTQYEEVVLFLPSSNADGLDEKTVQIEESDETARALVQALETEGALPSGTDVKKWSLAARTPSVLSVDLNAAFAEGILQTGTAGELMMLSSLINTLWAYYEPDEIVLTADGNPVETGHNIYDQPFTAPLTFS